VFNLVENGLPGQLEEWQPCPLDISLAHADSAANRVSWETEIVGRPVSAHPLELVARRRGDMPLRSLPETRGKPVTVCAVWLLGWPGGPGFFIGDGEDFHVARPDKRLEDQKIRWPSWRPMRPTGRWLRDEWGRGWFQVEAFEIL
jgi:hypothetical protein